MGTNMLFPYSKLSNESITEDWEGNKYFFAELPDVYSIPNTEDEQRVRYSSTKIKLRGKKKEYCLHNTTVTILRLQAIAAFFNPPL